ncbi:MAG: rRNA pseudouridine synthase [Clostridiales bacterium]|nr:rRNA pseudouridine synthase [Clostridiales bacterium]
MSEVGYASRRKSEELISQGMVKVNGRTAHIGDTVNPDNDIVTVNGRKIRKSVDPVYILLNKPRGFITTTSDEAGRKCVTDLVKDINVRLYPVGRLDRLSEGALILTNDGEFTNIVTHPSNHVQKVYRVTVRQLVTDLSLKPFNDGIMIEGRLTFPAETHIVSAENGRSVFNVTLHEGRNRQIRKMCEAIGLEVSRLKRISIGSVELGTLPTGRYRHLTEKEVMSLMNGKKVHGNA